MDRGDVFGQAPCCVRAEYVLKLRPVLSEEAKEELRLRQSQSLD